MQHFVSEPIELPASVAAREFTRADLLFYGVRARGNSYTARVFLDTLDAHRDLSPDRAAGYAGFFTIFGHGGCVGDAGHCDVLEGHDPFDTRPPDGVPPQTRTVQVAHALRAVETDAVIATVLAVVPSEDGPLLADLLHFTGLRLLTYL